MIAKIIKHWRDGDLKQVVRNYLNNFSVRHKIEAWRKIREKGEPVIIDLAGKVRLKLYTDSILSEPIFTGRFEPAEIDFVRSYLKEGDTFFDVGANIGLFTVIAAKEVGKSGNVYAFEPVHKTFSRLKENVELNTAGNVTLVNAGLSSSDGTLEMITSTDGHDAWNSFGKPTAGTQFKSETVNIRRLDSWFEEINPGQTQLMKLDVEGWEIHVIQGGNAYFGKADAPDLLVEFTEENCCNAGTSCDALYTVLVNAGYSMFTYDSARRRLIPEPRRAEYVHMNIIATKNPGKVIARIEGR